MNVRTILTLVVTAVILAAISLWMGQQSYGWFPPQAASEAQLVDDLFSFLVILGTFIFLGVTIAILYSVVFSRAGKYDMSDGPPIEGNTTLEVVWTAIPLALVIWIAVYSYQIYDRMNVKGPMELVHLHNPMQMATAYAAPLDAETEPLEAIEVHSRQWAWEFHYPGQNVSSTELHLPVDRRVHLTLESEDVLHGFYIPAFRLKQDIIPGEAIDFEFTPIRVGTYRLRDSQYSGTYFAAMQADVVVQSPEDYQQWLATTAKQPPTEAYNRAVTEFAKNRGKVKSVFTGWKSVPPAPPPVVNYSTQS
jgi:cytochrome c oxidase subunit 2